ncbi:MAG TPA: murein biosynthesis integral membrane protein MurJ [Ktedonobacteraceae bacterium]|nr:murein biosynthesis integral membrane protein MurJ [Ktedonobacteraceae bacterium]
MGNEGQQPPLPPQGPPNQPANYGWQYSQDQPGPMAQQPPGMPQPPMSMPPQQYPARAGQPIQPAQAGQPIQPAPQQLPPRYQQPIADMGSSLGYGQGMDYQYLDATQPSQSIPMLRQSRLQQLREERMRNQQRRMKPNISNLISQKVLKRPPTGGVPGTPGVPGTQLPPAPQVPPARGAAVQRPLHLPTPPEQYSPLAAPPQSRATNHNGQGSIPAGMQHNPALARALEPPQSAAEAAQNTGMIRRANIRRATIILTGAFIVSRILGLLRTSMFAAIFGATPISDAYYQAFIVPDLIFNVVAGGALSSAFIPVFTGYMVTKRDENMAWHIASSALNIAIAIMIGLALIAEIFAGKIVPLYNPDVPASELTLITMLVRIMLLQSIVMGAGVIITSVLQARQNFMLPAIGSVLYNVGLIAGLLPGFFLALHGQHNDSTNVLFATLGVVVGAILQVAIQIPGLFKVGMHYKPSFDWRHPAVIQIGRQMVPRVINAVMLYASIFVDRGLILLLVAVSAEGVGGLITQYYQAFQLVLLSVSIFGASVSTAAFPTISEYVARGRMDSVRAIITETLRSILFLSIPSCVGLGVLALPVIQVLYEHGAFSLEDAKSTAVPLTFFAIGLASLAAVEILTRAFYALRDSTTPVVVSVGQFLFKIALSIVLIDIAVWGAQWGMGVLAFSTSLAGLLEAAVLVWLLHQRIGGLQLRELGLYIVRVLIAAGVMGIVLLILRVILDHIFVTTTNTALGAGGTILAIFKLFVEIGVGLFIFVRAARFLDIEELEILRRLTERLKPLLKRYNLLWLVSWI